MISCSHPEIGRGIDEEWCCLYCGQANHLPSPSSLATRRCTLPLVLSITFGYHEAQQIYIEQEEFVSKPYRAWPKPFSFLCITGPRWCSIKEGSREKASEQRGNCQRALNCREFGVLDWPVTIDCSALRMHLKRFRRAACGLLAYAGPETQCSLEVCCCLTDVRSYLHAP